MAPKQPRTKPDLDGLPTTDHMDRLCAAYERIANAIEGMQASFERLVDDVAWGLNNDKFKPDHFHNMCQLVNGPLDALSPSCADAVEENDGAQSAEPVTGAHIAPVSEGSRPRDLFS